MRIALEDALPAALVVTTLLGCDRGEPEPPPQRVTAPSAPPSSAPAPLASAAEPAEAADPAPSASMATAPPSAKFDMTTCCHALAALAKPDVEPPSKYTIAAAVCSGIARQVKRGNADTGSARVLVRAQLHGVSIPAGC